MAMSFRGYRRGVLGFVAAFGLSAGCVVGADGDADGDGERVGEAAEPLTAICQAKVNGKGVKDVEADYLPHVVHCENGGAPYEALKAQAIAARTYLYYKIGKSGSINDGQSDQVYSCGSAPTAAQIKAVQETAGQVLRFKNTTIAAFFVAGAKQSPPSCKGNKSDSTNTEKFVTYNEGLSGSGIHQTTLGWVNPGNLENRGCMSQWGSRCLSTAGKSASSILKFYYGADIQIVQATGSCAKAPDADGDGVADSKDNCPKDKNADQKDTDKDKKGDACDTDDDNDGVLDTKDNCPLVANKDQANLDKDKLGDACDGDDDNDGIADAKDNCPKVANKGQQDQDKDKKGDACDDDIDGDGVANAKDNCPTVANKDQADANKDGKGDACVDDNDGDGVLDKVDNCANTANPEQLDLDKDGKGDVCDGDDDGDGVPDAMDNCPLVANPEQTDVNGDMIGDACQSDTDGDLVPDVGDNCPDDPNPDQEDEDGDGVGDACTPEPPAPDGGAAGSAGSPGGSGAAGAAGAAGGDGGDEVVPDDNTPSPDAPDTSQDEDRAPGGGQAPLDLPAELGAANEEQSGSCSVGAPGGAARPRPRSRSSVGLGLGLLGLLGALWPGRRRPRLPVQ
jgi:hypothetical protein